jgi:hypothetical protein
VHTTIGTRRGARRARGERGTALVELAIVIPVLVILLLGIVTAGQAYNQKLSLTNGAREGARYAATFPLPSAASPNDWLDKVASTSSGAVEEGFSSSVPGRVTCVAYVYPQGTTSGLASDQNFMRKDVGGTVTYSTGASAKCFTDGRPDTERRVQIVLQRTGQISTGFINIPLTLSGRAVARYEGTEG